MSLIDDQNLPPAPQPGLAAGAPAPAPSAGAALPPAQGGPSFSDTEMRTLSGGGRPSPYRAPAAKPAQETAQPFDLDALRKEIGEDLSSLGTREALDEAISGLGDLPAPAEEPPAPAPAQPPAPDAPVPLPTLADDRRAEEKREANWKRALGSFQASASRKGGKRLSLREAFSDDRSLHFERPDERNRTTPF
jgi:hypothetical protein